MIYLVHGIREDGTTSVGKFANRLNAYSQLYRYPTPRWATLNAFLVRLPWWRRRMCKDLVKRVKRLDHDPHAIAYSNGALVVWEAMRCGAQFDTIILFGAAFDADRQWPRRFRRMYCIHNPGDLAVKAAAKLWAHMWGDMGARGYQGPADERISNIKANLNSGHNYFDEPVFTLWVRDASEWLSVEVVPRVD